MSKADFEKNVQEKMQELRFQPSDEVWKRVEAGIPERKRRPLGFFWLTTALLVVGTAGYFSYNNFFTYKKVANTKSTQPVQVIVSKQDIRKENMATTGGILHAPALIVPSTSAAKDNVIRKNAAASKNAISNNVPHTNKQPLPRLVYESRIQDAPSTLDLTITPPGSYRNPSFSFPISQPQPLAVKTFVGSKLSYPSDLNSSQKIPSIPVADKSKWEYEINFSGGVSKLVDGFLQKDSLYPLYYSPATNSYGPSEVKKGLSFSIGGSVNKWLGARWCIGIGLGYEYFSTSIRIGDKVDSAIFVNQSALSISTVRGYYKSAGNTPYHNKYHFVSLPVTVKWQFSPHWSWENQAIYSRLIATNALHFDGNNGAYYKDGDLFNHDQFMFATALKFGWSKNRFQVGPQFQYTFTTLLNDESHNAKHLASLGLKGTMKLSKN